MGAREFKTMASGTTATEAFRTAIEDALHKYGHAGYTGSIAEKNSFVMITKPADKDLHDFIEELYDKEDKRIMDKWGDAGCIKVEDGKFCFFGLASE